MAWRGLWRAKSRATNGCMDGGKGSMANISVKSLYIKRNIENPAKSEFDHHWVVKGLCQWCLWQSVCVDIRTSISAWNGRFSRVQWSLYIRKYWKSEKIAITDGVGCGRDDHIFWKTGCRNYLQTWHNYRSVRSTRIKLRSWREKGNVSQFDRLGGVRVCAFDWS